MFTACLHLHQKKRQETRSAAYTRSGLNGAGGKITLYLFVRFYQLCICVVSRPLHVFACMHAKNRAQARRAMKSIKSTLSSQLAEKYTAVQVLFVRVMIRRSGFDIPVCKYYLGNLFTYRVTHLICCLTLCKLNPQVYVQSALCPLV